MSKLLLAEDDVSLGEELVEWLESENYFVDWERDGESALHRLLCYQHDVIILDWQLPGKEGPEICHEYRSRGGKAPIIFLTDRSQLKDKEVGFSSGADDYLPKPFALRELSMRLKALLRRPSELVKAKIRCRIFELSADDHKFFRNGEEIKLSPIEFALMQFSMKNEHTVFSSEAILERVWPGSSDRTNDTLKTCIKRLREKIDIDHKDTSIANVYGVGYKFAANVAKLD
ncbi:response regulator transcription factor [soil metagenome]